MGGEEKCSPLERITLVIGLPTSLGNAGWGCVHSSPDGQVADSGLHRQFSRIGNQAVSKSQLVTSGFMVFGISSSTCRRTWTLELVEMPWLRVVQHKR